MLHIYPAAMRKGDLPRKTEPNAEPPGLVLKKGTNIRSRDSGITPQPLSVTVMPICRSLSCLLWISTRGSGVFPTASIALWTRLSKACSSSSGSA